MRTGIDLEMIIEGGGTKKVIHKDGKQMVHVGKTVGGVVRSGATCERSFLLGEWYKGSLRLGEGLKGCASGQAILLRFELRAPGAPGAPGASRRTGLTFFCC